MSFRSRLVSQFKRPSGALGLVAGFIMTWRPSNRKRIRWTIDLLDLRKTDRVLEVGFGPGLGLKWAARRVKSGALYGVDHSATMTARAERRNSGAVKRGKLHLFNGTIDDLPPEVARLDKIYSVNVVQFLEDQTEAFRALGARLAPGGLIAMTFMPRNRGASGADAEAMAAKVEAAMRAAGLANVETKWLPTEPVPAICTMGYRRA